jgi:hypothetical protein
MGGGSRGFVFLNDKNPKVQITSGGDILAVGNIKASGNIHTDGKEIGIKNGVQLRQAAATGILENTGGGSLYLYGGSFGTASQAIKLGVSNTTYTNVVTNLKVGSNNIPEEALDVSGNIIASGTITNGSDRRLKTNIQPLTPRGELNPVTFIKNGKPDLGFIAQEVKELYPELVAGEETKDTFLTLNYSQLTAVLYAELKELRAEVKQLKQLIHNDTNV